MRLLIHSNHERRHRRPNLRSVIILNTKSRNRHASKIAVAVTLRAAVAAVGVGAANGAPSDVGVIGMPAAIKGSATEAPADKTPQPDPDAGLTNEQRDAAYRAASAEDAKQYAEWVQSDFVQSQDLGSLAQYPLLADYPAGSNSLEDAVDQADLAVLGSVKHVAPGTPIVTMFRIERIAKGAAPNVITIIQNGGIRTDGDYKHAVLAFDRSTPMLLTGDRAVLLLQHDPSDKNHYTIQHFSGEYRSSAGRVTSVKGNGFHDVDGMSEKDLIDRIKKHAKHQ